MAKCKNCKDCKFEVDCILSDSEREKLKICLIFEEKTPITNAMRIRSMTDEELAEFLRTKLDVSSLCENLEDGCWYKCKTHECDYDDTRLIIKWLKSEVGCE